jgi:hypothetical protein
LIVLTPDDDVIDVLGPDDQIDGQDVPLVAFDFDAIDGETIAFTAFVQPANNQPSVGVAYRATVPQLAACFADTNGDGVLSPADFNAWILAYNTRTGACDQNDDGACTPADFNAWLLNFNRGCG